MTKLLQVNTVLILVSFVLLFMLVGFIIKKRARLNKPVVAPKIMRYLVLPTALIYSFCLFVFEWSRTHTPVKVTETILIIFGISFLIQMLNHLLFSKDNILTQKETIPKLGRDIIQFTLVTISSAFVFSAIWGFDLGHLLTALGVGSFVLGLALQEPLGNLFNGIALLIAKTFEKGDWVEIGNDTGKIVDINWRSVKIVSRFNELIIIPNNALGKERIKNLSRPSKIHAELIKIGFSYKDNPKKVKKVLVKVTENLEGILKKPTPAAVTLSYENFYINYGLKFFMKDYEDQILLKDKIMTEIYDVAKENNLTIPYPIQELHIKNNDD